MAQVSAYLNFDGKTEEAFEFYKNVFKTEYTAPIQYMRDVPADPSMPPLSDAEKDMVMHVSLPITAGHVLMGTDMLQSMGQELKLGNNMSINVMPDTLEETRRLFGALSEGGSEIMELQQMFWGDMFGTFVDKFGVRWMFNCSAKE